MTYIKLNEQNQTIEYPPINKDNICNYDKDTDLLISDGYVNISDDLITLFNARKGKIENNSITDISDTDDYKKKVRLAEIEVELNSANETYTTYLDTPVQYSNGFYYKPKWAEETYITLLTAGTMVSSMFPMEIWDSTELESNKVSMELTELVALTTHLATLANTAFNTRKSARSILLAEKASLEA